MNKIILMGRLTRDPEIRYSTGANATCVARYSLAVDRRFKRENEPDADFFNCVVFGKGAELAEKYFQQGTKIAIVGRMEQDNYTNKNGEKVYGWKVVVDEQEFAESKPKNEQPTAATPAQEGFMNVPDGIDEELPFN